MVNISSSDLTLIGRGANSEVYKCNKHFDGRSVVVKISHGMQPQYVIGNYNQLRHIGMEVVNMKECTVDGKPAVLMENLFTDKIVYVSPNSVNNGHKDNLPEDYLLRHKLNDIVNINSLLELLKDLAFCTNEKGIELNMDMISFGVEKGNRNTDVEYKLVDIDAMQYDPSMHYKLYDTNVTNARKAIILFVKYFVETEEVKQRLVQQIDDFEW